MGLGVINNYKAVDGLVLEDFLRQDAFGIVLEENAQKWAFGSEYVPLCVGQCGHWSAGACMLVRDEYR